MLLRRNSLRISPFTKRLLSRSWRGWAKADPTALEGVVLSGDSQHAGEIPVAHGRRCHGFQSKHLFFPYFPASEILVGKVWEKFEDFVTLQQPVTIKYNILCILSLVSRQGPPRQVVQGPADRKSTRLNSSHWS